MRTWELSYLEQVLRLLDEHFSAVIGAAIGVLCTKFAINLQQRDAVPKGNAFRGSSASRINALFLSVFLLPIGVFWLGTAPNDTQIKLLWDTTPAVFAVIIYCFIVGQLTGNNSQVDKLWSIVPAMYVWHMSYLSGWNSRMVLMSGLVTIWAVRLTYNFARRGGYSWKFWEGEEDYRWEVLRKRPGFSNPFVWLIFNLFFVCIYQHILIFLFIVPIVSALATNAAPIGFADACLALVYVALVFVEYTADQQQYDFQTEKYRRIRAKEQLGDEYAVGFIRSGLWSVVRHPNYSAEQAIWIVFYLFSVAATGEGLNWTIAGSILLVILFKGSVDFSEEITAAKYPKYEEYQRTVACFIPNFTSK